MKDTLYIALLIVLALLFLQRECSRTTDTEDPEPIIRIEYIYDSVPYEVIKNVDRPVYITYTLWDTVWKYRDVDTAAILRDYFAVRVYKDTIVSNDDLRVVLMDSVHQNRLWGSRVATYQLLRPVDVNVEVECPPIHRNLVFLGGAISGNPNQFGIGPSVALLTKRDGLYSYSYDIINKNHSISVFYKLNFK